jgi:hypothetical protein
VASPSSAEDIDAMRRELLAAGWTPRTPVVWQSPSGECFLGPPAGAYAAMLLEREEGEVPPWE